MSGALLRPLIISSGFGDSLIVRTNATLRVLRPILGHSASNTSKQIRYQCSTRGTALKKKNYKRNILSTGSFEVSTSSFKTTVTPGAPAPNSVVVGALRDTLNIPKELAEALCARPSSRDWVAHLKTNPAYLRVRVKYLVEVEGVTREEIVENINDLMSKTHFQTAIPPKIFQKREMLHPFRSHAHFLTHHLGISLETFFLEAAEELELLDLRETFVERIKLLVDFGYPKDSLLKRWKMMKNVSAPKMKRRLRMIEDLEKSGLKRSQFFRSNHLFKDDKDFVAYLLKVTGHRRADKLPPSVANRVNLLAEILDVSPQMIVKTANESNDVANPLFKLDRRSQEIVNVFAAVDVTGEQLLRHSKFFKYKTNAVANAVAEVKESYQVEYFSQLHLNRVFSLLVSRRSSDERRGRGKKEPRTADDVRRLLTDRGFSDSAIADCRDILSWEPESVGRVIEDRGEYFSRETIASDYSESDRVKRINLLQYYVERCFADEDGESDVET